MNDVSSDDFSAQNQWSADELIPFGKYILLDRINSGATAAVYRANVRGEAGFERLVAIKRILPHMAGDRDFVDTFVREAKTVARLAHESICPIYELGKVGESLYMAVEYIQGKDLGLIMRRLARRKEPMPSLVAAWIAFRLCDALDYAHRLKSSKGSRVGMIHRDLSPSNVLVSYEGQVKLIDFGLARAVGRAQSTNVDALKKKLSYMSPEMVKGRPLDARSDIFGVGICLYEMVTGKRLFAADNDIDTLKLVGMASVPPPSAVVDDAPDELEIVIMHALERDPDDRFQSGAEMGETLQAYIQKTDPTWSSQRMAEWMRDLFGEDIDEEQKRIKELLVASKDAELIKQRRSFFASPKGAAARARAEIERRLSTEPPPVRMGLTAPVPETARVPEEARALATPPHSIDEDKTAYYDTEKTVAAPLDGTGAEGYFDDEPTQYLKDAELEEVKLAAIDLPAPIRVAALGSGTGGFDEEPTEIFFNKEENLGVRELLEEINDVEPRAGPLNKPIIAPELGLPAPRRSSPPPPPPPRSVSAPPPPPRSMPSPPSMAPVASVVPEPRRSSSLWVGVAALVVLAALLGLLLETPAGVVLGLRRAPGGTIELRTSPQVAAAVQLDGVYRGAAPLRLQGVSPGLRRIMITADGYLPVSKEVQLESGGTALVDVALVPDRPQPKPEPASESGTPPGAAPAEKSAHAAVAPAGASAGGTSAATGSGTHATSPRHHKASSTPAPSEGGTEQAAPTVRPAPAAPSLAVSPETPGSLAINTVPWSMVFIDGRDTGRSTPLLGYPVAPGWHEIRLQAATGQVDTQRVQVLPGQTVRISRRF